jgi:protocatechuate 3,4-dioxygenase beta subunit
MLKSIFMIGLSMITPVLFIHTAEAENTCTPTPPDMPGPFYKPDAPVRSSVGKGYVLSGTVRSSKNCSPISRARIEFWLAGPNGRYDDDHRATLFSESPGAYRFESNFPPSYANRPPHIHIRVTADGYRTLVTQHYPVPGQAQATFDLVVIPKD